MADIDCPYCGDWSEVCHDAGRGYAEDEAHEMTCESCEKAFVFFTALHFTYDSRKADCLNGAPHNYERTSTYPRKYARMRCKDCEHERALTDAERQTTKAA